MPTVKISELPLAESVEGSDVIPGSQDGTTRKIPVSSLTGPEGRLVFEWNGVDTSQFESVPAFRQANTGPAGTLSVESTPHGNVLRLNAVTTSGLTEIFLASDPLPFVGTDRSLVLEFEVYDDTAPTSASRGGPVFLANHDDDGGLFTGMAWAASVGNGAQRYVIEEDTTAVGEGAPSGSRGDKYSKYTIRGTKPDGAAPYFTGYFEGWTTTSRTTEIRRTGASSGDRAGVLDFASNTTFGSEWNDLPCDRWGIMTGRQTGGGMASIDFKSIRVFLLG